MSDFTLDDTMAELRYDYDEREIYNDIRSEIGITTTETVLDADATYSWKWWKRWNKLYVGRTIERWFQTSISESVTWKLEILDCFYAIGGSVYPYYDYQASLLDTDNDQRKIVQIENTGNRSADIKYRVGYKYKTSDMITHEETIMSALSVRAVDSGSILKYGRRVMNLTWEQGTTQVAMQALVESYLAGYKDPIPRVTAVIKGSTDALLTQIYTREISDVITVVCTELGLNVDYYIDSMSIRDTFAFLPSCVWEMIQQRTEEALSIFTLDTSGLDGTHILG